MANPLFIHRYECTNCDAIIRADRQVKCFKCGSEMTHQEKVGEIQV